MKGILYTIFILLLIKNTFVNGTEDPSNDEDIRIVGGLSVGISSYPYQAALTLNDIYICSAVIISRSWLLTTAKCVAHIPSQIPPTDVIGRVLVIINATVAARVGSRDRTTGGSNVVVKTRVVHPSYDPNTLDYNIAALQLTQSLTYDTFIRSIALPSTTLSIPVRLNVILSGWGVTSAADIDTNMFSRNLRAVNMTTISTSACQTAYNVSAITPRMFCARSSIAGNDACQGDEGGPVVGTINTNKVLLGLISWGKSCGDPTYPRVNTKILSVRPWIKTTTGV